MTTKTVGTMTGSGAARFERRTAAPAAPGATRSRPRAQAGDAVRRVSSTVATPVGRLTLVASDRGLSAVLWEQERPGRVVLEVDGEDAQHPVLVESARQLAEYFAGARRTFDLPLDPVGTPFQLRVWEALRAIPFSETRTYTEIARAIGHPAAVRAVGAANGRNPLSIVAPCHRVIGSDGSLTGFAGGLDVKARLLEHERGR